MKHITTNTGHITDCTTKYYNPRVITLLDNLKKKGEFQIPTTEYVCKIITDGFVISQKDRIITTNKIVDGNLLTTINAVTKNPFDMLILADFENCLAQTFIKQKSYERN